MKDSKTERGFEFSTFKDNNGSDCSLQKSSSAMDDKIWFGVNDANPQIMASDAIKLGIDVDVNSGWIEYPIPKEVLLSTRMHLTREQVADLLPYLHHFVNTGDLINYRAKKINKILNKK